MNSRDSKKIFFALLTAWFLINLLQAIFTEVLSDEAYYYLYGKYLDWGYFDHPPMVALLTRISSLLFDGNLSIRFMTVLLQLGTLLLIWKIIAVKEPTPGQVFLFFIIGGSICLFSAYGFITTPDAPLLFFTALFLLAYKNYLEKDSLWTVLVLSVSMAGLVYSKYQAVLVIGFVVLSNLRLIKMYKFWLAGAIALLLLSPHIYWQIANDFPSFKYHLIDRSEEFRWLYFFEYIPNQMVVFNPFILGAVIYVIIKYKPEDVFARALYFLIIGFLSFFWLISLRGHVEPHWTVACSVPMIILLFNKSTIITKLNTYIRKFIVPSLLLIFLIRILLMTNLPIVEYAGFDGKEDKYKFIESVSNDLPVAFLGSFQGPSLYTFFTGKESFAISTFYSRQTQFDIWQKEKNFQNKPVFIAGVNETDGKLFKKGRINITGFETDSLQTTNRMKIVFSTPTEILRSGESLALSLTIQNPCDYDIDFNHHRFPVNVCAVFIIGEKISIQPADLLLPVGIIRSGDSINSTLKFVIPDLPSGNCLFGISLNTLLGPTVNSSLMKIRIK